MENTPLNRMRCQACAGLTKPLSADEAKQYLAATPGWQIGPDAKSICRDFGMKDFLAAVRFIRGIAEVAEAEGHHPDIHLTGYRNLRLELSTHAIGGLSTNDFILAAKINDLPAELKEKKA